MRTDYRLPGASHRYTTVESNSPYGVVVLAQPVAYACLRRCTRPDSMRVLPTDSMHTHRAWRWLPLLLVMVTGVCGLALVRHGPTGFDVSVLLWFRTGGNPGQLAGPDWAGAFWLAVTWLGDGAPRIVVAALTVLVLLALRRWHSAWLMAGVLLSGIALSTALKGWIGRPRPQLVTHLDQVGSMSFPSGHALNSTLFYMTVALMLAPVLRRQAARRGVYVAAVGLSLAIGVSRIALGVHYPSDVIAGWVIAGAWLWLWLALATRYWPSALPQASGNR